MISVNGFSGLKACGASPADEYPLLTQSTASHAPSGIRRRMSVVNCRRVAVGVILALILSVQTISGTNPNGRYAILLVGKSGDPDLQKRYLEQIRKLHSLLVEPLGFPQDQVTVLFDDPKVDPDLIQHTSTRQNLENVCLNLSRRVKKEDLVFVFIEGHGSYDGKTYKLNLVGPDPTASELASILYSIPADRFVVVNATNGSGGSLPELSGEGKIVITATKSGMENNLTHVGEYFIESLKNNAADSNKDDRVSVMEAFLYANQKVEDHYKNQGRLQTEHPMLDDNGDAAAGQGDPGQESKKGLLARTTFFDNGIGLRASKGITSEQAKLELEAGELEKQIETLKYNKAEMLQSDYEKKLEELLLKLARINEKLQK